MIAEIADNLGEVSDKALHVTARGLFCVVAFFFVRGCMGRVHHWGPSQPWGDPTHSALQILNERFAKGEIQKEEYNERKGAILSGSPR